ncbi:MAG: ribose 5-phosphate isomerase B [Lachnospiraceae bacterium]|nr:ribose 5-phosphate isomerase B [Lachnospiraceae bacterium]
MIIGFGNDHSGVYLKNYLVEYLESKGHEVINYGVDSQAKGDDYPVIGRKVAEALLRGEVEKGILIGGVGAGICLAANKVSGVRAVLCSEPVTARVAVNHNNCNMICMGSRIVGKDMAKMILDEFLSAEFEGGRHQRRLDMIAEIEHDYTALNTNR